MPQQPNLESSRVGITRRVFVSVTADDANTPNKTAFKWALIDLIRKRGLFPEIFFNPRSTEGLAAAASWTPARAESVLRQCVGAVLIGLPRWRGSDAKGETLLASEYCQYEGAVAKMLRLPFLIFLDASVRPRGVFEQNFGEFIAEFPSDVDATWVNSPLCSMAVDKWMAQIQRRRDIFMGYCSRAQETAGRIKQFITAETGATVLDWKTDFGFGRNVLQEISEGADRCNAGLFLFTKDDFKLDPADRRGSRTDTPESAIPRDNVVFETGYFMALKGPERVLMVREKGTHMPADLGGIIYALLEDRENIDPIKSDLQRFVGQL